LSIIRAVAGTAGIPTFFFWQPSVYEKRNITPFEDRIRQAGPPRLQDLYRRAYEIAAQTCAGNPDFGVHDLGHCFGDTSEPWFIDFFHLSELGNAEVAAKIVEKLLPVLRGEPKPPAP